MTKPEITSDISSHLSLRLYYILYLQLANRAILC
jgi:hypothetical protein